MPQVELKTTSVHVENFSKVHKLRNYALKALVGALTVAALAACAGCESPKPTATAPEPTSAPIATLVSPTLEPTLEPTVTATRRVQVATPGGAGGPAATATPAPTATIVEVKPTVVATAATKELTLNAEQLQYTDHVLMLKDQATGRYKIPAKGEFTVVTDVATGKQTIKDKDNKVLEGFLFTKPTNESAKDWNNWTKMEIETIGTSTFTKLAVFNTGELVTQPLTVEGETYTVTGVRIFAGDKQGFAPLVIPVSIQAADGEEFLTLMGTKTGSGFKAVSYQAVKEQLIKKPGQGFILETITKRTVTVQDAINRIKDICGKNPASNVCKIPARYESLDEYAQKYVPRQTTIIKTLADGVFPYLSKGAVPPADSLAGYPNQILSDIGLK